MRNIIMTEPFTAIVSITRRHRDAILGWCKDTQVLGTTKT
jgi:hypothetical protein